MLFGAGIASAQNSIKLISAQDGSPIFGAHVAFVHGNNKFYCTTDQNGICTFKVDTITYNVTITHLSYETINRDIKIQSGENIIKMSPSTGYLKTVEIVSNFVPQGEENSVQKVLVIDSKRIEAQGAVSLEQVLSNDLNIRLSKDNILGSTLTMGGVGGENIKILVDGVPIIGRLNGSVDLSQINMQNVERIEVIQGPASVQYGTNALGGVINIITKKPKKNSIQTGVNLFYETVGRYNADAFFGFSKKKHQFRIDGGRYFFDGFNKDTLSGRTLQWKPKRQVFGGLSYGYTFGGLTLRYQGNYFHEKVENKGAPIAPFNMGALDEEYITQRYSNAIFLNGYVKPKRHIDITVAHSGFIRERDQFAKNLVTLERKGVDSTFDSFMQIMSRGTYTYVSSSEKLTVQAGYDIAHDWGKGLRIKDGGQNIGDYAFFTSAEYTAWKKLTFKPGFRYGYNTRFKAPPIPSFSLMYKPHKYITMRATWSRGFRAPDIKELYFEFIDINHYLIGNENLKAERSDNVNFLFTMKLNKEKYAFSFEPGFFYNNIRDRITLAYTDSTAMGGQPIYRNINIGKFQSMGVTLNTTFNYKNLSLLLGGALVGVNTELDASVPTPDTYLLSPEGRFNASYSVPKWKASASLFYKYTGKNPFFFESNGEIVQGRIADYHTLDVSITKSFFKESLILSVYGKNLFNVTNILQSGASSTGAHSSGGGSMPLNYGRTFAVSVKYIFKK